MERLEQDIAELRDNNTNLQTKEVYFNLKNSTFDRSYS